MSDRHHIRAAHATSLAVLDRHGRDDIIAELDDVIEAKEDDWSAWATADFAGEEEGYESGAVIDWQLRSLREVGQRLLAEVEVVIAVDHEGLGVTTSSVAVALLMAPDGRSWVVERREILPRRR